MVNKLQVSSLSALTLADTGCAGGETGTPDASDQPIASSTSASQPAASLPSAQVQLSLTYKANDLI